MKNADYENALDPYKDYHSLCFEFVVSPYRFSCVTWPIDLGPGLTQMSDTIPSSDAFQSHHYFGDRNFLKWLPDA